MSPVPAPGQLTEHVQAYLYGPADKREAILNELDGLQAIPDDPISLVEACFAQKCEGQPKGVVFDDHFQLPPLRERYPEELLSFLVPDGYDGHKPTGLMILLHGGGMGTGRDRARLWLEEEPEGGGGYHFREELSERSYISVAPSNLLLPTHQRWSNPESDAYLLAVMEEAACRYNIDPDRVYLMGQSMGGFGAFHVVQTLGDRFATIGSHAGAWYYGFWEGLRNVDFCIIQGANDNVPGERPRFTDLPFARMASAILSGFHIPHTYIEHDGGHSFTDPEARKAGAEFLQRAESKQRDPYPDRVVTCSRKGAFDLYESPHHYWISIDAEHHGSFEMDHIEPTESNPSYWTTDFRHRTINVHGGAVDAVNNGENHFTVRTRSVDAFTLWLSPAMVDFSLPVHVEVNGRLVHSDPVEQSLRTTLESFDRKRDVGQLYSGKIEITTKVDDWALTRPAQP